MDELLRISNLKTYFYTEDGEVPAVDDVSLTIGQGESVGLVGESGCGKSVTALSVMRLVADPPGKIIGGEIKFQQESLLELSEPEMRKIRGNDISMIFQEPMTSLNPVFNVGNQIAEAVILHQGKNKKEALQEAIRMLTAVSIPDPEQRVREYPHQLSGGMRQRVMIAMALSCNPQLLIADEPTTALDVTIQAQILELIGSLRHQYGLSLLLITHDLGVVAEVTDRVYVMYAGKIVEEASTLEVFGNPKHPYTVGLLRSVPRLDATADQRGKLETIEGVVPDLLSRLPGCYFEPRCEKRIGRCCESMPKMVEVAPGHRVRCHLYG